MPVLPLAWAVSHGGGGQHDRLVVAATDATGTIGWGGLTFCGVARRGWNR